VNGGNKQIRLIKNWPNPNTRIADSEKVPSIISYKNGQPQNWGYEVEIADDSFRWFKILLDPAHKYSRGVEPVTASKQLLSNLNKSAEEVAADYLRLIWEYTKEDIRRVKGQNWASIYSLKVVLTVPAIWSPAAKDRTERVARAAGLPDNISLVTEPEAAALAVLKEASKDGMSLAVCSPGIYLRKFRDVLTTHTGRRLIRSL
jgi:hypothetical protein